MATPQSSGLLLCSATKSSCQPTPERVRLARVFVSVCSTYFAGGLCATARLKNIIFFLIRAGSDCTKHDSGVFLLRLITRIM